MELKKMDAPGTFVIPIDVTDEQDLYEGFDAAGLTLSESLKGYLSDFMEDRKLGDNVRLELTSEHALDIDRFRQAYGEHIKKLRQRSQRDIKRQLFNALRLLGIGIVFVLIGIIFAGGMGEVTAAIVSTIGSFAIWEAAAVWLEEMPIIKAKDRILLRLSEADIRYRKKDVR